MLHQAQKRLFSSLHQTQARRRFCICLLTTFHLNTIWSQQLLQKIARGLLAPWETIITDKIEKPIKGNSGLNLTVASRCWAFLLGLFSCISLILIHVRWSLTLIAIQCNKGFSSTEFNLRNHQKLRFMLQFLENLMTATSSGEEM